LTAGPSAESPPGAGDGNAQRCHYLPQSVVRVSQATASFEARSSVAAATVMAWRNPGDVAFARDRSGVFTDNSTVEDGECRAVLSLTRWLSLS
jgi:hypothetical protein